MNEGRRFRDQRASIATFGPWKGMPRAIASAIVFLAVAGCRPEHEMASAFPRAETLYVGGRQWGEPSTFNPLTSLAWPIEGVGQNLLYENLFTFNWLTGKMEPLLAESYTVSDDAVEVVMNPAARWNDGRPLTAGDVKYTFDLGKKYKGIKFSPVWKYLRDVVVSSDGRRVIFLLDRKQNNPIVILDQLQEFRIVPRHAIEHVLDGVNGDVEAFE
jgi:peptide/nickel transport system substrate-binding protein